jgi:purine-cytosine permease-like protein
VFFILIDETDNAFAHVYSTAVSLQNVAPNRRQFGLVLAATAVAVAGAFLLLWRGQGLGGDYELFLIAIGGLFVPLLGAVIADSFVVRRASYRTEEFEAGAPGVRWSAILSWASGAILYFGVYFQVIPNFPPIGATLPSFALAASLHIVFSRAQVVLAARRASASGGGPH